MLSFGQLCDSFDRALECYPKFGGRCRQAAAIMQFSWARSQNLLVRVLLLVLVPKVVSDRSQVPWILSLGRRRVWGLLVMVPLNTGVYIMTSNDLRNPSNKHISTTICPWPCVNVIKSNNLTPVGILSRNPSPR